MSEPIRELQSSLRMIDANEVAKILDVSTRTVWRLVARGELPQPLRFGRNVRWRIRDIEACIDTQADLVNGNGRSRRPH